MGIIDDLKSIGKALQEAGKIEQYNQILEAQKELLEMQKKIYELEEKNRELEEKLKFKESLVYKNNAFWTKDGEGPYCPGCWGKDKKPIRMQPCGNPAWSECPVCKERFKTGQNRGWSPPASPKKFEHL